MTRAEQPVLTWRKSSYSDHKDDCVEIARTPDVTLIRDSKNPDAGTLQITNAAWHTLLTHTQFERSIVR